MFKDERNIVKEKNSGGAIGYKTSGYDSGLKSIVVK